MTTAGRAGRAWRELTHPGARPASLTTVVLCVTCMVLLSTALGLLASAQADAPRAPLPQGTLVVAPQHKVTNASGDELGLAGTPYVEPGLVREVSAVPSGRVVAEHHASVVVTGEGDARGGPVTASATTPVPGSLSGASMVRGRGTRGPGEAVIGEGLAESHGWDLGSQLRVVAVNGTDSVELTVVGLISDAGAAGGQGVVMDNDALRQIRPAPPVSRLWIGAGAQEDLASTRERLRALAKDHSGAIPYAVVAPGEQPPTPFDPTSSTAVGVGVVLSVVVAIVCGSLLMGVAAFAVARRAAELARRRLIGATPWQVRLALLRETLLLTVVAVALGTPIGMAATPIAQAGLRRLRVLPGDGQSVLAAWPFLAAAAVTMVLPAAATLMASRRVARIRPTQVFREKDAPARRPGLLRRLAGVAVLAATLALAIAAGEVGASQAPNFALTLTFTSVAALALLGPDIMRGALPLLGRVSAQGAAGGFVAGRSLAREPYRASTLAQSGLVGVALGSVLLGAGVLIEDSAVAVASQGSVSAYVSATGGIPAEAAGPVRAVTGVADAVWSAPTSVVVNRPLTGLKPYPASVVDQDPSAVRDLDGVTGPLTGLDRGVAISSQLAQEAELEVGSRLVAHTGNGTPVEAPVVAVVDDTAGMGDVIIGTNVLPRRATPGPASIAVSTNLDTDTLQKRIAGRDLMAGSVADRLRVVSATDHVSSHSGRSVGDIRGVWVIAGAVLVMGVIGTAVNISIDIASRRSELSRLRASGATVAQLRRTLLLEALLSGMFGLALACAVAYGCLSLLARVMPGAPGVDLTTAIGPPTAVAAVGAITVAALIRVLVSGRIEVREP